MCQDGGIELIETPELALLLTSPYRLDWSFKVTTREAIVEQVPIQKSLTINWQAKVGTEMKKSPRRDVKRDIHRKFIPKENISPVMVYISRSIS